MNAMKIPEQAKQLLLELNQEDTGGGIMTPELVLADASSTVSASVSSAPAEIVLGS